MNTVIVKNNKTNDYSMKLASDKKLQGENVEFTIVTVVTTIIEDHFCDDGSDIFKLVLCDNTEVYRLFLDGRVTLDELRTVELA